MKTVYLKRFLFLPLLLLFLISSCQEEVVEVTDPTNDETIVADSALASLMQNTARNDGSVDNIIDFANCLEVELPVTVVVDGVEIIIDSEEDFDLIEEIFDEFDDDEDLIEILFPITVISSDYTEIVIENQEALDELIRDCHGEDEEDEDIECIDFQYPITISVYNTDFVVIDTVTINDDEALYDFIEGLEGGVLASLNFPVTMILSDGSTVVVENNAELETAISEAEDDCDEDDDYDWDDDDYEDCDVNLSELEALLLECDMEAYTYDAAGNIIDENYMTFQDGGEVIVNGVPAVTEVGSWSLSESDSGYVLTIEGLVTFDLLNGEWLLNGCDGDEIIFSQGEGEDLINMELEQDCEEDPIGDCEYNIAELHDWLMDCNIEAYIYDAAGNIIDENYLTFQAGGVVIVTGEITVTEVGSWSLTESGSEYVLVLDGLMDFDLLNGGWILDGCERGELMLSHDTGSGNSMNLEQDCMTSTGCSEENVDAFLLECIWNVVNFNGDDHLIEYNLEFFNSGVVHITGDGISISGLWSTTESSDGVVVHISDINPGAIQEIEGDWLVVECREDRLQMENNLGDNMVVERDCGECDNPGILTNDLIIYMPFSNELHELISGVNGGGAPASFVEDRSGNSSCALSFTGGESVLIPLRDENQLVQGDSFTVSLWFKMQNTEAGDLELFFRSPGDATQGFNLGVYDLNTPLVFDNGDTFSLWDNDWNYEVDVEWENTDWHHLVLTVDSDNTVRLYRDGEQRNVDESSSFNIGSDPSGNYILGEGFVGHLDDLRVYKRTLSASEVEELYNLDGDCYTCL